MQAYSRGIGLHPPSGRVEGEARAFGEGRKKLDRCSNSPPRKLADARFRPSQGEGEVSSATFSSHGTPVLPRIGCLFGEGPPFTIRLTAPRRLDPGPDLRCVGQSINRYRVPPRSHGSLASLLLAFPVPASLTPPASILSSYLLGTLMDDGVGLRSAGRPTVPIKVFSLRDRSRRSSFGVRRLVAALALAAATGLHTPPPDRMRGAREIDQQVIAAQKRTMHTHPLCRGGRRPVGGPLDRASNLPTIY